MIENLDHLEVHPARKRQHSVSGAEARMDPTVGEFLAEECRQTLRGLLQALGSGSEDDVVQAHAEILNPRDFGADTGGPSTGW